MPPTALVDDDHMLLVDGRLSAIVKSAPSGQAKKEGN